MADVAQGLAGGRREEEESDSWEGECRLVEVLRMYHPHERVLQPRVVGAEDFLAVRPVMRVCESDHVARLCEGERHHRERAPAHPQADETEHVREHERDAHRDGDRLPEAPVPVGNRDVRQVDADRDVQRVPEREQPGEPELDVIGEREPCKDEARCEEREGSRARKGRGEQLGGPEGGEGGGGGRRGQSGGGRKGGERTSGEGKACKI